MATNKTYLQFILDQLSDLEALRHRAMMREYILYYRDKIVAYLCDDRLLVKPTPAARARMPGAPMEAPYEGAKEMLLVENVDDRAVLADLLRSIYPELPAGRRR